jgi:outer membrane immunogenic protein
VSLGVLGFVAPALGADLPLYAKAPPAASQVYDWSGFYVGVFGGGGYGNHNFNNASGPAGNANFTQNYSSQGPLAGGELGYNVQSGSVVGGVEADFAWFDINGNDNFDNLTLGVNNATSLRSAGTLRARGGIAVDRMMLFFTGGWAYGDLRHTSTDLVSGVDQFTSPRSGLTAGAGISYALTDNLIGKFEYRYYNFGTFSRSGVPILTANGQLPYNVDNTYSVVTLGFDYKFGPGSVLGY